MMAYISTTQSSAPRISEFFARVSASLHTAIARRKLFAQTRFELESLSNRDLADLGISRGEINAIARQAAMTA